MHRVLHGLQSGHFTWHLLLIILLVFVATPFLKHQLYGRARRGGSIYLPPRQPEQGRPPEPQWTEGQMRQARRLLQEQKLKDSGGDKRAED